MSHDTILPGTAARKGEGGQATSAGQNSVRKEGLGAYTGVGTEIEPLARQSDIEEFRAGYARFKSGEWDAGKWQGYRLRFGVYGQIQPNVHMIRIKIPGGILPIAWARRVAEANRRWGGAPIHVSTRQDLQLYFVKPDTVADLLDYLAEAGITTREACGNTIRNITACSLSGTCAREHTDAGKVAERLAHSWIRHPLAQHMPRKFKITVSGCETDCGGTHLHDLGLVATRQQGRPGFKVYAGGGTGGAPVAAALVADFVEEADLPAVLEALLRLHQRYSNRRNRNKARIKFVHQRFGSEKFRALFQESFESLRGMPQRPWPGLRWRSNDPSAPEPKSPGGVVEGHDGTVSVVFNQGLGLFTSDELDQVATLAEAARARELRTTREQNLIVAGVPEGRATTLVAGLRALGFAIEDAPGDVANVVSCPGTSTCAIGITNSQNFAKTLHDSVARYAARPELTVRISGCQNGCGLHHVADFGFRGMGKKIGGKNAPHYMLYIGGGEKAGETVGLNGPIVPARLAKDTLDLLLQGYADSRHPGEPVRDWALRLGKEGIRALIRPIESRIDPEDEGLFFDFGEDWTFSPPAGRTAECAAGIADDDLQKDLADDSLINVDRALDAGNRSSARHFATEGFRFASQRLRIRIGMPGEVEDGEDVILSTLRAGFAGDEDLMAGLNRFLAAREAAARESAGDGTDEALREALATWIDLVEESLARPAPSWEMPSALLEDENDGGGAVAALMRDVRPPSP